MKAIAVDPFGQHPAAMALVGSKDKFRLRVAHWRALYRVERAARRVYVEDVVKREEAYR